MNTGKMWWTLVHVLAEARKGKKVLLVTKDGSYYVTFSPGKLEGQDFTKIEADWER